jgi:hypothetical protein
MAPYVSLVQIQHEPPYARSAKSSREGIRFGFFRKPTLAIIVTKIADLVVPRVGGDCLYQSCNILEVVRYVVESLLSGCTILSI